MTKYVPELILAPTFLVLEKKKKSSQTNVTSIVRLSVTRLLHRVQFAVEDPHYGYDAHGRKERRHEEQRESNPRGHRRRGPEIPDDANARVANRTRGHRAQRQESLSQPVDEDYGQRCAEHAKRHVCRLKGERKRINIINRKSFFFFFVNIRIKKYCTLTVAQAGCTGVSNVSNTYIRYGVSGMPDSTLVKNVIITSI